jgi:protein transport protein SEC23
VAYLALTSQVLPYEPIPCKQCSAILNPYATVDFTSKVWTCPFCHTRNHFPPHYQGITETNLPAELYPNYCTIEYTMSRTIAQHPPVYLLVIDTCVSEDELQACKDALMQALQVIPDYACVGLITYGTHVQVHELGFTECMKSWVFRGTKDYTSQQVVEQLGMGRPSQRPGQPAGPAQTRKFIQPLNACEFQITQMLEELQKDAYPVGATLRPVRCTGTALQVPPRLLLLPPPALHQPSQQTAVVAAGSSGWQ